MNDIEIAESTARAWIAWGGNADSFRHCQTMIENYIIILLERKEQEKFDKQN